MVRNTLHQTQGKMVASQRRRSSDKRVQVAAGTLVANAKTNVKAIKPHLGSTNGCNELARKLAKAGSLDLKKLEARAKPADDENHPLSTLPPIKTVSGTAPRHHKVLAKRFNKH